ncbi:unnamed protein product [Pleuronectes platessa]|uniref:Uncharacterized protein n=1 Tax=Pleuronectes platessa TaxID=8262 RepID=A0A9N7TY14_PLEPL|nr:unnamed protein product [Pleuronectes platessa]
MEGWIFVWIQYEGRWSVELANDRGAQVSDFTWSHDGTQALVAYRDGFVLVGSVSGQRHLSSEINLESQITCGIWTPDDQQYGAIGSGRRQSSLYSQHSHRSHPQPGSNTKYSSSSNRCRTRCCMVHTLNPSLPRTLPPSFSDTDGSVEIQMRKVNPPPPYQGTVVSAIAAAATPQALVTNSPSIQTTNPCLKKDDFLLHPVTLQYPTPLGYERITTFDISGNVEEVCRPRRRPMPQMHTLCMASEALPHSESPPLRIKKFSFRTAQQH